MTSLRLAPTLSLPLDAVTQRFGFLGRIGSGKSYAATKLAELMLGAGAQVVAIDPVGIWYGLRVDGAGKGFPIHVLGGLHGDVPLESTSGAMIADLIVDRALSAVLDVSQFATDTEKARFAGAFAERFYFRKKASPSAVHLYLEECQEFVPEKPSRTENDMLHHFTRMAKLGRNFGIGLSLISQRPQEVNKKVLNLTECLFTFQMTGVHERRAIRDWVSTKGADTNIVDTLPSLPVGVAHVYSPQWLQISRQAKVHEKRTADVSSTPTFGASVVDSKPLTPVDLDALREKMAATIQKAKADDPKELRKRIAELERDAAKKPVAGAISAVASTSREDRATITRLRKALEAAMRFLVNINTQNFDVAGVDKAELERAVSAAVDKAGSIIDQRLSARANALDALRGSASRIVDQLQAILSNDDVVVDVAVARNEPFSVSAPSRKVAPPPRAVRAAPADGVSKSMQRVLDALAALEALGIAPAPRINAAFFAGYTENGHFNNMLGTLRTMGLLDYPSPAMIGLTDAGRATADASAASFDSLAEMHRVWLGKVSPSEGKLLQALIDAYPAPIERGLLAQQTGYTENGHFNNMLGHLRTLGVVEYPGNRQVAATDVLFPKGLR